MEEKFGKTMRYHVNDKRIDWASRMRGLLAPPVFEDEEQSRQAGLLNVMLLASIAINILGGIPAIYLERPLGDRFFSTSVGLVFQVIVLVLLRRRHVRFASLFLLTGFWLTITWFSFFSGGIDSPLIGFYGVIVLGAGLLSGARLGAGFAGLSIASAVVMYYFQQQSILPAFVPLTSMSELLDHVAVLLSIAVVLYLALRSLHDTLERALAGERAQIKANHELTMLRASLEERVADLERADKSLRDSETLYHSLVENLPQNVYCQDREGRLTFANQRYCAGFGKPLKELLGKTAYDLHPFELAEQYCLDDRQVMERGEILEKEEEHQVLGGDKNCVQVVKIPTYDSMGKVIGIQGIFWDITERKRAEGILRQSHQELEKLVDARTAELAKERNLLRTLVEALPDLFYIKDTQSRFILTNTAQARLLGANSPADLVGKSDADFFPTELAAKYYADEQALIKSGQSLIATEEPTVNSSGNWRWLTTTKIPFRDPEGKVVGIVGMGRDITQQRRTEDALRESEARFRELFEASPDAVVLLDTQDPSWPIIDCNSAACEMNGYSREQLIGKSIDILNSTPGDQAGRKTYLERLKREGTLHYETLHRRSDGSLFPIEVSTRFIKLPGKELLLGIDRDITERKLAEESLRQLSTHDSLTGLYNRAFFEEELERLEVSRLFPVSIVVCDVDGLKKTNDTLGHAAGDDLLRWTATVLRAAFRAEDMIARMGGDEFVVLLPQTAVPGTAPLSISMGAATSETDEDLTRTFRLADEQMYQHKAAHKKTIGEQ